MLLALVYFVLRRLLRAVAPSDRSDLEREAELLVLRHQLKVLSRGVRRPPFRRRDRMLLAGGEPDPLKRAVERLRRDPSDPAPVAPGARPAQVDVSTRQTWPTDPRSGDGRAHHSLGE